MCEALQIIRGNSYGNGDESRLLTYAVSTSAQPTDLSSATYAIVIGGMTIPIPAPVVTDVILFTISLTISQTSALNIGQVLFDITASWGTESLTSIVHNGIAIVE